MRIFTLMTSAVALPLLAGLATAQHPLLLKREATPSADARVWADQEQGRMPTAVRKEFVRIDTKSLLALPMQGPAPLGTYEVRLFGNSHVLDIRESHMTQNYRVFEGRIRGRHGDTCIVVAPDGKTCHATIHMVEDSYAIHHANSGDLHVAFDLDDRRNQLGCGCCNPAPGFNPTPAQPTGSSSSNAGVTSAMTTRLDVAVFYTNRAMATAGSRASVEAQCITGITKANRTCTNSAATIRFRLVLLWSVNYTEDGSSSDLSRFAARNDGIMDGVHTRREQVGADLMHLITQPAQLQYCGVGYLMNTNSSSFAGNAFGVTVRSCINGNTVAHEIGHNIGCHHDRGNTRSAPMFNHAYGFRTSDSRYRTTMSYAPGSRVEVWSSPTVRFGNYTMGNSTADNKRTVDRTRAAVAGFRGAKDIEYRNIGGQITGVKGVPTLTGVGLFHSNTVKPAMTIGNYPNSAPGMIVIGLNPIKIPFFGGTLIPNTDAVVPIFGRADGADIRIDASALSTSPLRNVWVQTLWRDSSAVQGISSTPGIRALLQ